VGISGLTLFWEGSWWNEHILHRSRASWPGKTILANQVAFDSFADGRMALYVTRRAETHHRLLPALGTLDFFDCASFGTNVSYVSVFQILRCEGKCGFKEPSAR
jgi:hypothetical protein